MLPTYFVHGRIGFRGRQPANIPLPATSSLPTPFHIPQVISIPQLVDMTSAQIWNQSLQGTSTEIFSPLLFTSLHFAIFCYLPSFPCSLLFRAFPNFPLLQWFPSFPFHFIAVPQLPSSSLDLFLLRFSSFLFTSLHFLWTLFISLISPGVLNFLKFSWVSWFLSTYWFPFITLSISPWLKKICNFTSNLAKTSLNIDDPLLPAGHTSRQVIWRIWRIGGCPN